jgi:hypothetical protein
MRATFARHFTSKPFPATTARRPLIPDPRGPDPRGLGRSTARAHLVGRSSLTPVACAVVTAPPAHVMALGRLKAARMLAARPSPRVIATAHARGLRTSTRRLRCAPEALLRTFHGCHAWFLGVNLNAHFVTMLCRSRRRPSPPCRLEPTSTR